VNVKARRETTSDVSRGRPECGFLGLLRAATLIAVVCGAAGSIAFLFHASQRRPPLLMAIFVIWVLSPFMALLLADTVSKRWSVVTRVALYSVMLILALGSLAIYEDDALRPRRAQAAFVYVAVPPASWLLFAIVPMAAFISRRLSRRG
jgi:hypothetical protein